MTVSSLIELNVCKKKKKKRKADPWRDCISCLYLSVPLCPLSLYWHKCLLDTHGLVSLEWLSISLSALLSSQLGTCTTILTSRGLLPAPNTLLPSVSLVVSSTVQHGRRRAAGRTHGLTTTLVCLSCCWYDGLLSCTLKAAVPLSTLPCGKTHICGLKHVCFLMTPMPVLRVTHLS